MMMIPKWGNYPGDGGGGITLVIDTLYAITAAGSLPKTFAKSLRSFSIWPFYATLGLMIWLSMRIVISSPSA